MAFARSDQGRERIKYNSQKGGLYVTGFLNCTEACCYRQICPVYEVLVEGYGTKTFTGTCAVEVASYIELMKRLDDNSLYSALDPEIREEFALLSIKIDRICRFISLYPDMTTRSGHISKAYTLLQRHQKKLLELILKIRETAQRVE